MVGQSRRVCQLLERKITPSGEFSCSSPVDGDLPRPLVLGSSVSSTARSAWLCSVRPALIGSPTRQGRSCQSRLMDSDGYGYTSEDRGTARLLDDMRTLSPAAIERIAHGWELHSLPHLDRYHEAEAAALRAIENAHLTTEWEALQPQILDLTEGRTSLVSWKVEHGEKGHHGE